MGSSYTFFKLLDLSRSNGQKKTLINANILIRISLIIPHLLYFISISKLKKSVIFDSLYVSLSISFSSTVVPPPWIDCQKKKKKNRGTLTLEAFAHMLPYKQLKVLETYFQSHIIIGNPQGQERKKHQIHINDYID